MDATSRGSRSGAPEPTGKATVGLKPSISLVLPAYNEEAVIQQAIQEADDALAGLTDDYEVIVVDDGSSDRTKELAELEARTRPAVRVIAYGANRGYGAALRTGFAAATKQWIGFTDADCQFDVTELDRLTLLLRRHDIACGYRIDRQDHWLRCFYSRVYNTLVSAALGTGVRDCDCALKLFRREVIESTPIETNGFLVNAEILTKARLAGKSVVEVGVTHRPRPRGTSTVSVWHTIPVLLAMIRFWWSTILFPGSAPESASAAGSWTSGRRAAAMLSLFVLSLLMLFGHLSYPLIEPDESRYAQIALEMVQSGDYLVPHLRGEAYLDKPPLLYWMTAGSYRLVGASEFASRLPAAVAAMLTVLATFWIGRRIVGCATAYVASIMMFLCLGFVLSGRFLVMDSLLALSTTVALLAGLAANRGPRLHVGWWIFAAIALALGVLTKGPIAPVLVLPPLALTFWLTQRLHHVHLTHWLLFGTVAGVITLPWFVLMAIHQPGFVEYFVWQQHVVRFVNTYIHQEPVWYYVPVLAIGMFPSSLLFSPLVVFVISRHASLRRRRNADLGGVVLGAMWILVFFSLSSCKLPTYILPALPLMCLVQAAALRAMFDTHSPISYFRTLARHLPVWGTGLALTTGAGLAAADLWLRPGLGWHHALDFGMLATATLSMIAVVARRSWWNESVSHWGLASTVCLVVMAFAFQRFVPALSAYRSINANAARLQAQLGNPSAPVVYLDRQSDAATFYLDPQRIRHLTVPEFVTVREMLAEHSPVVLVGDQQPISRLRESLGQSAELTQSAGARGRVYLLSVRSGVQVAERPLDGKQRR